MGCKLAALRAGYPSSRIPLASTNAEALNAMGTRLWGRASFAPRGSAVQTDFRIPVFDLLVSVTEALDLVSGQLVDHHKKVAYLSLQIAAELGLPTEQQRQVAVAALLHDIGAISLDERKQALQFELQDTKAHCERGAQLLGMFEPLAPEAEIIRYHHAHWECDGTGQPCGEAVPLTCHVVHLADRISILLGERKGILPRAPEITERIKGLSGTLFAPEVVEPFVGLARKESFWLDSVSPSLGTLLRHRIRLSPLELNLDGLTELANVFRRIVDYRSRFTATHSSGVAASGEALAGLLGFSERDCRLMRVAGYLHDLGKLAVPNEILDKPAKLTPEEFAVIRSHTYYTSKILEPMDALQTVNEWGALHHERLDGNGYPFHMDKRELSLGSRIMAVADVFTAITEDRPYREGMTEERALKVLKSMAGHSLDGNIVNVLEENYDDLNRARSAAQRRSLEEFANVS